MEDITVEKIIRRIKENLSGEEPAPNFQNNRPSLKQRFLTFGIAHKDLIIKIPLLNRIAQRVYRFMIISPAPHKSPASERIKSFIRKIPLIGFLAWWTYSVVKAPSRLLGLSEEIVKLRQEVVDLSAQLTSEFEDRVKLRQEVVDLSAQLPREIEIDDIYITKGPIDADSYLAKAWDNNAVLADYDIKSTKKDKLFYYAFENLFRGTTTEIEKSQSLYMPYVFEANTRSKGAFFLDLGCGRGEFLALLRQQNIPAKGVDIDEFTVDLLRKDGFDVTLSDSLDFLQAVKNNALKGLTMFQVIEHLNFEYMKSLLAAAFKKIAANGVIILESVNPYCPVALGTFYLDPTHVRPMPPDLVKFMLEWYGFVNVLVIYYAPLPKSLRHKGITMNYEGYAVIGERPGK